MTRPKLVYVAPCWPAEGGSGIAMRCGLFLEAAARRFDVHLAVVPLVDTGAGTSPGAWARSRCSDTAYFPFEPRPMAVPRAMTHPGPLAIADWNGEREPDLWSADGALVPTPCQGVDELTRRALVDWVSSRDGRVVLVSRLSVAALLADVLAAKPRERPWILDIDDHDSAVALQLADLHAQAHEPAAAVAWLLEAQRFARLERVLIEAFDATCVAAAADVERITERPRCGQHEHVPNAVHLSPFAPAREDPRLCPQILFVGSLGYLPNILGVEWFVRKVLPRIRAASPAVEFRIAGRSPVPAVQRLAAEAGVSVVANPDDVLPLYGGASIIVCPVFAGGGSRIKILEAFSAGVPVVSTEAGADGLSAPGRMCLVIANDADSMAAACLTLLGAQQQRASLVRRARDYVESHHLFDRVSARVGNFLTRLEQRCYAGPAMNGVD